MAKEKINIVASKETYQNLVAFRKIDQLNETVRAYKEKYADELSKTDIAVLNILHNYSAKYLGVSFLTKKNIGKLVDRSRRTIVTCCNKLEKLGIIKQYDMKRKSDMQQTSNAIVIQPIVKEESKQQENGNCTQGSAKPAHHKNKFSLRLLLNIKHLNMSKASKRRPYIKLVPKKLQHYQAFFGDKVKSLYGRVWLAMKKLNVQVDKSIMQDIAHTAFSKLVEYVKQGRSLSSEDMHKIVYTISYKQLQEREDTKYEVQHQNDIATVLSRLNQYRLRNGLDLI